MGTSKNLLFENACGFSRQKNGNFPFREEKENRNTDRSLGFLPVLWPERGLADSDFGVFRSALISKPLQHSYCVIFYNPVFQSYPTPKNLSKHLQYSLPPMPFRPFSASKIQGRFSKRQAFKSALNTPP